MQVSTHHCYLLLNGCCVWQSLEASRLQPVLKDKERAQEVSQRAVDLNESFSKETEKKLQERMDAMQEKKKAQIQALLDRLSLHVSVGCLDTALISEQ